MGQVFLHETCIFFLKFTLEEAVELSHISLSLHILETVKAIVL